MKMHLVGLMVAALAAGAPGPNGSASAQSQQSQIPASVRLAMPGPEHRWLEPLIGDWTVEMLVYFAPGAQPVTSRDLSATRVWLLDRRYLREELRGTFAGNPSARDAIMGYNRLDGRFELVTIDTFEPGQMIYQGRGDETERLFSLHGQSSEAGLGAEPSGRHRSLRFEIDIRDRNYNVQRIFARYPGEKEFLFVEQRFTRRNP